MNALGWIITIALGLLPLTLGGIAQGQPILTALSTLVFVLLSLNIAKRSRGGVTIPNTNGAEIYRFVPWVVAPVIALGFLAQFGVIELRVQWLLAVGTALALISYALAVSPEFDAFRRRIRDRRMREQDSRANDDTE